MNRKLELEFSELLLSAYSDNTDRMAKILGRLSFDQREKLARSLLKALYPTLYYLPGDKILALKEEYRFDINVGEMEDGIVEVAQCQ